MAFKPFANACLVSIEAPLLAEVQFYKCWVRDFAHIFTNNKLGFHKFAKWFPLSTSGSCLCVALKRSPSCVVAEVPGFAVFVARFAVGSGAARIFDRGSQKEDMHNKKLCSASIQ